MNVKRERIFLYLFIFLIICLQNISAQKTADRQKSETPETFSDDGKKTSDKSSASADLTTLTVSFSKNVFESHINDFRYNFLDSEIKKNRKFITDEENEELKRRSFMPNVTVISEKNIDQSKPCEDKKLNQQTF